ncbi:MAG TPA: flagellar basal body-associated FliL family protein [Lacunisphaera sp.]|nr:flagellar basal body-associated FliL family protein [Lacunisphaera sp.]
MAEKPDPKAKDKDAAAPEKAGSNPAQAAAAGPAKGGALKAWLPVVLAVIVAPATCWAVAEFVLLPRLQAKLAVAASPEGAAQAAAGEKASAAGGEKKKGGHGGKEEGGAVGADTYSFSNVVVNLSGTMGTRYLKTSFVVTGIKPDTIKAAFEENKDKLTDVTLGVLSSLSLSDLEEPGAKNVLREKLVTAYNQALGSRVAEQVYFSDFVVQ